MAPKRISQIARPSALRAVFLLLLVGILSAVLLSPAALVAQSTVDWPMETLRLKDGRVLKGFVQSQRRGETEFIEIIRPPGKPMYGVLYPVGSDEIAELDRLDDAERQRLADRFDDFRHRAVIEAGRMEALSLKTIEKEGRAWRVYQGPWFVLESTADETTTRRCIVRIEQTFRAYRMILPPEVTERRNLRIVLHGAMDDYRTYLRALGIDIANPAYFSVAENEIVAGSDLSQYAEELAKAEAKNQATQREYLDLNRALPEKLRQLAEEMQGRGFTKAEIKDELQARRAAWATKLQKMEQQLAEIRRRNEARFVQVTRGMFRRLAHEAFHAYVENYVFPRDRGDLPRWLNEGLAQIFESGQLEADAFRIDAPDAALVKRLQQDLNSGAPLPLSQLLTADARQFVKSHASESTDRHYLYAWGLAWYLTFEFELLRDQRLDAFASLAQANDPQQRFEELVGAPLETFERKWRAAMNELR